MKKAVCFALVPFVLMALVVSEVSCENDSEMEALRFQVMAVHPDSRRHAMQSGATDVWTDLERTADIEELDADGFLVTQDLGFHIGFIGFNIRADQSYRRPEVTYWPLHDVEFRHALFHCFDQLRIIQEIYGYIATPVRSLVPPAQSKYYNAAVPAHPYDPGDPFTSTVGEHSTCGILKAAGYTFNDAGTTGVVDDADYWKCPDDSPLPHIDIYTPLMEIAPTSYQLGAEFVADLAKVGLGATASGQGQYRICNLPCDFNEYLDNVFYGADFDAYMVFYSLGRLPTQLYSLLHSSELPWHLNANGVDDSELDLLLEIVKFSLDVDAVEAAAKQIQQMIYTPDKAVYPNADNFALAYMALYSRSYFNAYNPDLRGIVRSRGFGSDNRWTFANIYWLPGTERIENGKKTAIWTLDDAPDSLNPLWQPYNDQLHSGIENAWKIAARSYDGLLDMNPYNHRDLPWLAADWAITETADGMEIDFTLRDDVYWQDGVLFTAYDVEFCLEFLRDYQIPRYAGIWLTLIDVVVTDATQLTIQVNEPSKSLFYEYAYLAAMLPPQVWDRPWVDTQAVLDYDPTEPYNVAPGYTPGPTPPPTNLFGTGQWIFQFYDAVNQYGDVWKNPNYFMSTAAIDDFMADLFWEVGDINRDGIIDVRDLAPVSIAYGVMIGDPEYDPDLDIWPPIRDGIIDIRDLGTIAFHLLWQREYP